MEIFSLETKKHLVGWSVVFGFLIYFFRFGYIFFSQSLTCGDSIDSGNCLLLKKHDIFLFAFGSGYAGYLDIIFWFLVSLIILSLIRHFRKVGSE